MTEHEQCVIEIYQALAAEDYDSDSCYDPEDLTLAMCELYTSTGATFKGDYAEAVDWAAHLVTEQHREDHPEDWQDGLTQREADQERASCREDGPDCDCGCQDDGIHVEARTIDPNAVVVCLSTFRDSRSIVEYAP